MELTIQAIQYMQKLGIREFVLPQAKWVQLPQYLSLAIILCKDYNHREVVQMMPNAAETIERLARELERQKILSELQECDTLEEFQEYVEKLKAKCE